MHRTGIGGAGALGHFGDDGNDGVERGSFMEVLSIIGWLSLYGVIALAFMTALTAWRLKRRPQ